MRDTLVILLTLLLLATTKIKAQEGNLYVKNYTNTQLYGENNAIVQSKDGIMYFANNDGILSYDGVNWSLEEVTGTAYAFAYNEKNTEEIYLGGQEYFGYLKKAATGTLFFQLLSDNQQDVGEITDIVIVNEQVYFYSQHNIFIYSIKEQKVEYVIKAPNTNPFSGWFVHKNRVIVNVENIGLHEIMQNELRALPNTSNFAKLNIQTYFAFDEKQTMLGTSDNQLHIFNETSFKPFVTTVQTFLNDFVLRQGVSMSEQEFVLSTASGGCVIVNKKTGVARKIINTLSGLADDEITAIHADNQNGLWVCHKSGISRVALDLPISAYSTYPGLQGNVTSVIRMGYQLFVGTNKGIYYLTQNYWSKEVTNQDRKAAWALQSATYFFKKLDGIDAKCKQLINYKGKLIAATNTGLYEISAGRAYNLLSNTYISAVHGVPAKNMVYVSTENGLIALKERIGFWEKADTLRIFKEDIGNILEHNDELWLGGITKVANIHLNKDGSFGAWKSYKLQSSHAEPVQISMLDNRPVFLTSKAAFRYVPFLGGTLMPDKALSKYFYKDCKFFTHQEEHIWLLHQNEWQNIYAKEDSTNKNRYAYLSLFRSVQDIYEDIEKNIWVVGNGDVYCISAKAELSKIVNNEAFVRTVRSEEGEYLSLNDLELSQDNERNFVFQITLPFYLAESDIQYQYKLAGLDESKWTPWRNKAAIEFPFLPSGRYELQIRAKNALGQQSATHYFKFKVAPPFWETWWFYSFEILLMLGLLVASVIFNRKHKHSKFSSIITLVSIITVFEFVVLLLEPYVDFFSAGVPVFKLLMNILLAYYLIPLEKSVRTFIEENKHLDRWTERFSNETESVNVNEEPVQRTYQNNPATVTGRK